MKFIAVLALFALVGLSAGCSGGGGSGNNGTGGGGDEEFTFRDITDKSLCNGSARYNSPFRGWNMVLAGQGNKSGREGRMKIRMYIYQDTMVMSNECLIAGSQGWAEVRVPIRVDENAREIQILESREKLYEANGVRCGITARKTTFRYELSGSCLRGIDRRGDSNTFVAD